MTITKITGRDLLPDGTLSDNEVPVSRDVFMCVQRVLGTADDLETCVDALETLLTATLHMKITIHRAPRPQASEEYR